MLYLSLCALNSVKPDVAYVKKLDLDKLFADCQRHKITSLVCYALEGVVELPKQWSEAKGKAIRKSILYSTERDLIADFMNKNGIKYMFLKGIILENYYPKVGMREMSDNDIYYDIAFRQQLEDFMLSLGYECTYKSDEHDVYEKEPVYNFELHHSLFLKEKSKIFYDYYRDIDKRMIKDDNDVFGYRLSNEDLYIYLLAHEYKHFSSSGTGIRSLLDILVFLDKFEDILDWKYIKTETDKIGISDFEETQRILCKKMSVSFIDAEFSQEEVDFLKYLISSGVYGDFSINVQNRVRGTREIHTKITFFMKVKYVFKRLFPPIAYYKNTYPFFYKHKYLLPVCILFRLFKAVFKPSSIVKNEIKILNKDGK